MVTQRFSDWAMSFAGCDGGDLGTKERPATWICGIEWGGGHDPKKLESHLSDGPQKPCLGYESWTENLAYIFNWQTMKLLSAINGGSVENYKVFAENVRPFVKDSSGFFKMNLFPFAFPNTDVSHWSSEFSSITGFATKSDYLGWCRAHRLTLISTWTKEHQPSLVVGLGKTYRDDFGVAFGVSKWSEEFVEQHQISWARNESGSLVVVLPFMVNRNGLTRNSAIQSVGQRIAVLLKPV